MAESDESDPNYAQKSCLAREALVFFQREAIGHAGDVVGGRAEHVPPRPAASGLRRSSRDRTDRAALPPPSLASREPADGGKGWRRGSASAPCWRRASRG